MKIYKSERKPDFNNLLKVLNGKAPERPTLFEFILNRPLCQKLAEETLKDENDILAELRIMIKAFNNAGYDYVVIPTWVTNLFSFPNIEFESKESRSLNDGTLISDRVSYEQYPWPNPDDGDYEIFNTLAADLPDGMKMIPCGPGGVLENTIDLVGYERLCYMILEDPELAKEIFDAVHQIDGVIMYKPPLWAVEHHKSKTLPATTELIKKIKKLLDPNNIMNPGQGIEGE